MSSTSMNEKEETAPREASARALANLALVKYFGKRNSELNLPAAGSLSLTLEPLATTTTVSFEDALENDTIILEGVPTGRAFRERASLFLETVRQMAGVRVKARVTTINDFPTGAGLASSSSGFAALALAATRALGLELDSASLSALARRGSGSAARSIPGGIALWHAGTREDGSDSFATQLLSPRDWDLRVVVGISDPSPKELGSTEAMELTRLTSPYYQGWLNTVEEDLTRAVTAVEKRDMEQLGEIAERSALAMHAAAMAAKPGIVFFKGATVEAIHLVRRLRKKGLLAYFTCDAGPQPKVLCSPEHQDNVVNALQALPGLSRTISCHLGEGARIVSGGHAPLRP